MKPARTLALKREALAELTARDLSGVAAGDYTGLPGFCVISITAPCVTNPGCQVRDLLKGGIQTG